MEFRIWLAWHQASGTLWVAMERFDDLYFNLYDGAGLHEMVSWDSSIAFMVDGDHTGGMYGQLLGINCEECTAAEILWNHRQAQRWMGIAEAPGGGDILDYDGASDWVTREPYAAAGGGVIGESPATTVTEFKVTPFDDLIYDDEDASQASRLLAGKIIGFSMSTTDNDDIRYPDVSSMVHRGHIVADVGGSLSRDLMCIMMHTGRSSRGRGLSPPPLLRRLVVHPALEEHQCAGTLPGCLPFPRS